MAMPFRPLIVANADGTTRTITDSRTGTGHRTLPLDIKSLLSSKSSARMPFGPFSLVGLCPTLPDIP